MTIKIINHKKVEIENIQIPCKCGCGNLIWKFDKKQRERHFQKGHTTKNRGYLIRSWNKGKTGVFSEKTIQKMRKAKIGKQLSQEHIEKIIKANKKNSDEENFKRKLARSLSRSNSEISSYCDICGSSECLEKHHWRYDQPLLVNTLCKTCHKIQHIKNFNQSRYAQKEVILI